MLTQSSLVQEALLVNEKVLAPEKPSHRTSIFKEIDDVPRLWGRESQSGYRGKRALTLCSDGEKDYSIDSAPGCHDADYGYEMPERYGGKEVAYGDHPFKLLAGNNNTWVPPYEQRKKICGFGQMAFWIMFGILCLLVVSGAIAAGFVAASSSRSTTR
jgi:hypothetical protein